LSLSTHFILKSGLISSLDRGLQHCSSISSAKCKSFRRKSCRPCRRTGPSRARFAACHSIWLPCHYAPSRLQGKLTRSAICRS
jgi:hypothetical protein